MELQVAFLSEDQELAVSEAADFKNTVEFYLPDAEVIQLTKPLGKDQAGVGVLDSIVQILLGKGILQGLIDTLKTWVEKRPEVIGAKKSKIQMEIKDSNRTITLNVEGVKDLEALIDQVQKLTPEPSKS